MRKLILALERRRGPRSRGPGGRSHEGDQHLRLRASRRSRSRSPKATPSPGRTGTTRITRSSPTRASSSRRSCRPKQTFSFTFTRRRAPTRYKDELHPKLTGKIIVKGLPPTLTLAASAPIVTSGTKVTLSGVVSSHKAGESVTIYYQPYPQPNLIQRATVLTSRRRHVQLHRRAAGPDHLPGRLEGRVRDADHGPGARRSLSLGRNNGWIIHAVGRPLVRRPGGAVPAPEHRDRPVGDAQEGAAELEVVGARSRSRCRRASTTCA